MEEFLTKLWQMIPDELKTCIFVGLVLVFVGRIIAESYSAFKTKCLSGAIEILLKEHGIVKKDKSKYVQNYSDSNLKKEYRFNSSTKELVETGGFVDVQKQIDSYKETSLESILDKFMPTETTQQVVVATNNRMVDKLDELAKIIDVANGYRNELGLADDVSISDVYRVMSEKSQKLNDYIKSFNKINEEVNNNEKDVEKKA